MNQRSIDLALPITNDLWEIKEIFYRDELIEVLDRLKTEQSWQKVELQEHKNREQLAWEDNNTCDWLFGKLSGLDFTRFDLKLRTVMIWKDMAGYTIEDHVDNDRIGLIQIDKQK